MVLGRGMSRPTVFAHACKMGLEGIASKRKNSTYRSGRRDVDLARIGLCIGDELSKGFEPATEGQYAQPATTRPASPWGRAESF